MPICHFIRWNNNNNISNNIINNNNSHKTRGIPTGTPISMRRIHHDSQRSSTSKISTLPHRIFIYPPKAVDWPTAAVEMLLIAVAILFVAGPSIGMPVHGSLIGLIIPVLVVMSVLRPQLATVNPPLTQWTGIRWYSNQLTLNTQQQGLLVEASWA